MGILKVHAHQVVDNLTAHQHLEFKNSNRLTPYGGVRVGVDKVSLEIAAAHRPRYVNLPVGGGEKWYKPGLVTVSVLGQF